MISKKIYFLLFLILCFSSAGFSNANDMARRMLEAERVKNFTVAGVIRDSISSISIEDLGKELSASDEASKTFWINLYNALLISSLENWNKEKISKSFYAKKILTIGNLKLSLKTIKDDLLRTKGGKKWEGLKPKSLDYRFHFAIGSGVKYSPLIAVYQVDKINFQLKSAEGETLRGFCHMDTKKKRVYCPPYMKTYKKDFGGKSFIKKLLKRNSVIIFDEYKPYFDKKDNTKQAARFTNY